MSDKKRIPRQLALAVGNQLVDSLRHCVERIEICGSIRRKRTTVSDVEILYVPKFVEGAKTDMFRSPEPANCAEARIAWMEDLEAGNLLKRRLNVRGFETWGPKNKLAIHIRSGIPVDLFSTTEENWWMSLVIRTGPAEMNLELIDKAANNGLKLHAYGVYERISNGEKIVPKSEQEVFELAGLKYLPPERR